MHEEAVAADSVECSKQHAFGEGLITELLNFIFQLLEVVSRCRDTQLQVTENVCYLWNLCPNIFKCFKIECIF